MQEVEEWARLASAQGWTVETTGGGHMRWTPPNGGEVVFTASTPSGGNRALANELANLKRAGLMVDRGEIRRARRQARQDEAAKRVEEISAGITTAPAIACGGSERGVRERVEIAGFEPGGPTKSLPKRTNGTDSRGFEPPDDQPISTLTPKRRVRGNVPCPALGCKMAMTVNNIGRHMKTHHPRYKKTGRGGTWLSPRDYMRWQETGGDEVIPIHGDEAVEVALMTDIETYEVTTAPDRTPDNLLQACITAVWPDGRVPLKSSTMLIAAAWVEGTEKFLRDLLELEARDG